jgi:hypothetical protein
MWRRGGKELIAHGSDKRQREVFVVALSAHWKELVPDRQLDPVTRVEIELPHFRRKSYSLRRSEPPVEYPHVTTLREP